jgi:hypothetical protein
MTVNAKREIKTDCPTDPAEKQRQVIEKITDCKKKENILFLPAGHSFIYESPTILYTGQFYAFSGTPKPIPGTSKSVSGFTSCVFFFHFQQFLHLIVSFYVIN